MKALVWAFNQEKALVGAFSVIVQPVVEPMDRFTALLLAVWPRPESPRAELLSAPHLQLERAARQLGRGSALQERLLILLQGERLLAVQWQGICGKYLFIDFYGLCLFSLRTSFINILFILCPFKYWNVKIDDGEPAYPRDTSAWWYGCRAQPLKLGEQQKPGAWMFDVWN